MPCSPQMLSADLRRPMLLSGPWEPGLPSRRLRINVFCLFVYFLFCFCFVLFSKMGSLCSHGCPGTCSVDQTGLELKDLPAPASQVL